MPDKDFTPALEVITSGVHVTSRELALVADEREFCARFVESIKMGDILLAAGEMTAQERRTLRALLPWLANRIRNRT